MSTEFPVLHPQVAMQNVDGSAVIVLADSGEVMVMNEVGTRTCELIDGTRSLEDIAVAIQGEYEVTPEEARSDVREFLQTLFEAGAVSFLDTPLLR